MTDANAPSSPVTCPACGAAASGKFCQQCGAALGSRTCIRCQAAMRAGARFCHKCGTPASGAAATPAGAGAAPSKTPWLVAGILIISAIALVTLQGVNKNNPPAAPLMPNAGSQQAPFAGGAGGGAAGGPSQVDIASMSPVERFNRLFNRIMRSAGAGDTAQAMQFAPMAAQAYGMLEKADYTADTRLHMGLVYVVQKDARAVKAVADTILAENPNHLFGYILRGDAARLSGDAAALQKAIADFSANEAKELARQDRVEYTEHQPLISEFKGAAAGGN